ncbi:hypothetical protein KIL84_002711 [Mauremys mutica]|uniref:Uncharacterized protein n=1 Tax=Mauremys mutica TaxID=74926 RepID=A0A9D3WTU2_9SAUR|nr:hypothetical protein KIL84_002711 [Mauremys mutica]
MYGDFRGHLVQRPLCSQAAAVDYRHLCHFLTPQGHKDSKDLTPSPPAVGQEPDTMGAVAGYIWDLHSSQVSLQPLPTSHTAKASPRPPRTPLGELALPRSSVGQDGNWRELAMPGPVADVKQGKC